jgi:hypothetical protein
MKTTDLLLKRRRDIEGLLHRLVDSGEGDKRALLEGSAGMAVAHATIEQGLLYPAKRGATG